jgi:very-short-patch-repair endonuclease
MPGRPLNNRRWFHAGRRVAPARSNQCQFFEGTLAIHSRFTSSSAIHRFCSPRTIGLRHQHPLDVRARAEVDRVVRNGRGLISRRDHPGLANTIVWLVRRGKLVPVLPGVYAPPELAHNLDVMMRAVNFRQPDAVILGAAAARASFWPDAPLRTVDVAAPTRLARRPGYTFSCRRIPPELIVERDGLRYTTAALTAIDLATFECADAIDIALRTRAATLSGMYEALRLTPNRTGNQERLRLLIDSRNEPWSAAERLAHRILRGACFNGWEMNHPIFLEGHLYYIDIAFKHVKLAIEIDGRRHEDDEDLFESDRWRQNALVADGWRVLRFTWRMLKEHPEVVVAAIRQALISQ